MDIEEKEQTIEKNQILNLLDKLKKNPLIVVLGVVGIFSVIALIYMTTMTPKKSLTTTDSSKSSTSIVASAGDIQIIIDPVSVSIKDPTPLTIDVLVNAKEFVNEVSIDFLFDPRIIGQFSIKSLKDPNSALSTSFEEIRNYVDVASGNATFTVRIPNTYSEQRGMAKVARITMTPIGITANGTILTVSTSSKATSKTIGPSLTVGTSTLKNVN